MEKEQGELYRKLEHYKELCIQNDTYIQTMARERDFLSERVQKAEYELQSQPPNEVSKLKVQNEELRVKLEGIMAKLDAENKLVGSLSAENLQLKKQINEGISQDSVVKVLKSIRSDENMEVYDHRIRYQGQMSPSESSVMSSPNLRDDGLKELKASIEKSIDSETAIRLINLIDDLAADLEKHERQNTKLC